MAETHVPQYSRPEDELNLIHLLMVMWRGKWYIICCVAMFLSASVFYVHEIAIPRYRASATLVTEQRQAQVLELNNVISGGSMDRTALQTELEIMRSPDMVRSLVVKLDLHKDPEFNAYLRPPERFSLHSPIASVRGFLNGNDKNIRPEQTEEQAIASTVSAVMRSLSTSIQDGTFLFAIQATTGDRSKSVKIANTLADIYISKQVEVKFSAIEYAVDWLSARVNEIERDLLLREKKIIDLQLQSGSVEPEVIDAMTFRVNELSDRLAITQQTYEIMRNQLEKARQLLADGNMQDLYQLFDDPQLLRLSGLTSNSQIEEDLAQQRVQVLIANLSVEILNLEKQRNALQRSVDDLRAEADEARSSYNKVVTLTREAEATRTLLETFVARLKETSLQIGLQQADSRLVSPARSARQVEPRSKRLYSLSIVLATLAGTTFLLLRQFIQRGFRSATELSRVTGHSVIGQVPTMPIKRRNELSNYLITKPTSSAAESVRDLRTSILMLNPEIHPQVIMITSSVPAEGKTTVSIALTMQLASIGKRVLLIDGDMRRGTLGMYSNIRPAGGLAGLINNKTSIFEAIQKDENLQADILIGPAQQSDATDLLMAEKFAAVVGEMREVYDHIIIDTPPVLVVPDARVIAQHCDNVIYIVRWNYTNQGSVEDGIRQLEAFGTNVTGLVLSQVDARGMKRYGYSDYYGAYGYNSKGYYSE